MFDFIIVVLTAAGWLASAAFTLTWIPAAIKGRLKGNRQVSLLRLLDYAALPLGIHVLYTISVINLLAVGVVPARSFGTGLARIMTLVIFDLIVGLRAWHWLKTWIEQPGAPVADSIRRSAFSDHHEALEGDHLEPDVARSES